MKWGRAWCPWRGMEASRTWGLCFNQTLLWACSHPPVLSKRASWLLKRSSRTKTVVWSRRLPRAAQAAQGEGWGWHPGGPVGPHLCPGSRPHAGPWACPSKVPNSVSLCWGLCKAGGQTQALFHWEPSCRKSISSKGCHLVDIRLHDTNLCKKAIPGWFHSWIHRNRK